MFCFRYQTAKAPSKTELVLDPNQNSPKTTSKPELAGAETSKTRTKIPDRTGNTWPELILI